MRISSKVCLLILPLTLMLGSTAKSDVVFDAYGTSAKGVGVHFQAAFSISGDVLNLRVSNLSSEAILNPDELLGSLYFDIVNDDNVRPDLLYTSATGDVYCTSRFGQSLFQPQQDLMALNRGDGTWQFKTMDPSQAPSLGFGLGTVGNSDLSPNNFNGNIVGGIDFAIFSGDITTRNLQNRLLVKDEIHFEFGGMTGFTESDIVGTVGFGLGTRPDSVIISSQSNISAVPEPGSFGVILLCGLTFLRRRRS